MASKRQGPIFMFGVQVPRNETEARKLDDKYVAAGLPKPFPFHLLTEYFEN